MTPLDQDPRRTAGSLTVQPEAWHTDPWDDPDSTDALAVERPRRDGRELRWYVWGLIYIVMAAIVIYGVWGLRYTRQVNPPGDPGAPLTFVVKADDTLQTVSDRLAELDLVTSASLFRSYVADHGGMELIPGYFLLRPNDHMGNLMHALSTPPSETFTRITFPEGYTLEKMSLRLQDKQPRLTAAEFMLAATDGTIRSIYQPEGVNSLEGLLFPDTYQVSNGESAAQVVLRMVKLMERVGRQEDIEARSVTLSSELGFPVSPYQVLVVASLIEREAKVPSDRAKIARVIYNRLALGMPLQVDAAVYYQQDASLPFDQLRAIDTPYNTYLHLGLPPTPIANPGRASIDAALHPAADPSLGDPLCAGLPAGAECHYLYYVIADEEGRHVFAVTVEQHDANVQAARDKGLL